MFRRKRKKKKPQVDTSRKRWSIAFLISIPTIIYCLVISILVFWAISSLKGFDSNKWSIFLACFLGGVVFVSSLKVSRTRTLIHELKHAAVVVLSGNILTDFHIEKETGHVTYSMYRKSTRFEPFIILAPYFFPLLSIPALIANMIAGASYPLILIAILGLTLAIDITTAYDEFHPQQTDLQSIKGGILTCIVFVVTANLLWLLLCLLWVQSGFNSLLLLGTGLMEGGKFLVEYLFYT